MVAHQIIKKIYFFALIALLQQIATSPNENLCKELFNRGAAGSGRDDDNPETLHKRFVTYNKDTMPMVDHLEKEGLLRRIDAKRTIDEVYEVSS